MRWALVVGAGGRGGEAFADRPGLCRLRGEEEGSVRSTCGRCGVRSWVSRDRRLQRDAGRVGRETVPVWAFVRVEARVDGPVADPFGVSGCDSRAESP